MDLPELVGQLAFGTVFMKALDLVAAVTAGRLDHTKCLSVGVTEKCVRVLDALTSFGQHVLAAPEARFASPDGSVVQIGGGQQQVMITMLGLWQSPGSATCEVCSQGRCGTDENWRRSESPT